MQEEARSTKASEQPPSTPPASVDEMRALLMTIMRGESEIVLGKKAREAFGQILALHGSPDLLSITKLSQRVGTNPSTITRLAQNLGYEGFGDFQKVLFGSSPAVPGTFYLNKVQDALTDADSTVKQRATQLCRENQANIDRFIETFDSASFEKAVELVTAAPRVCVFGIRQFHSLAAFLVYGLRLIRRDVSILNANALGAAEELSAMEQRDVCILASVAPYSREVVRVARAASECGLSVIAITDFVSSPLVNYAETTLFASHQSSFISNSITSYFAVAECLINATALASPEQTKRTLKARETSIERLGVEQD
ncbi:MAG: MurR/RpiR family transcriptional regulator [Pseudomonadota bacterium]